MPNDVVSHEVLEKVAFEFTTTDGPNAVWRVSQMRLAEAINEEYDLELDLVTREVDVDSSALLGASAELVIRRGAHARSVYGIVSELEHTGQWGLDVVIRVRVVPAFALLRQRVHTRIFQDLTVQEIVGRVLDEALGEYGRSFSTGSSTRGNVQRDYCVQYHESDRDFVVRLLEEEGLSFHFAHDDSAGHEVLVLTDDNRQFASVENLDGAPLVPIVVTRPELVGVETLRNLDWLRTLTPTKVTRLDFAALQPRAAVTSVVGDADDRGRVRRSYEHMRRRYVGDDVAERARDHLEASRSRECASRGESNATAFTAGRVFELDRHPHVADLEGSHVLTCVVHEAHCPEELPIEASPDLDADARPRYHNVFECVPLAVPVRPLRTVAKPIIPGPQTAIVTGPSGEEIEVDEHGRIKVQFPWQEDGAFDETSSCWVPVAQSWAGPGWGAQFIPRIGMEVVVVFLEGDPDRPLVSGCLYNGDNAPPFALPADKTQSGLRTDSSIGNGFNELRFEDRAGSEEIYMRAQRDKRVEVKHDHARLVGRDETIEVQRDRCKSVERDQNESVGRDKGITVAGRHEERVQGDFRLSIGGERSTDVGKNRVTSVAQNDALTVSGNRSVVVERNASEQVQRDKSVVVDGSYAEKVASARSIDVTKALTVESGDKTTIRAGKDVGIGAQKKLTLQSEKAMSLQTADAFSIVGDKKGTIELADELTIKVGKARIVLKKNGDIEIGGGELKIKTTGDVTVKGGKIKQN